MNINIINKDNIYLLENFIKLNDSEFFRYYVLRSIDVIKNHIVINHIHYRKNMQYLQN